MANCYLDYTIGQRVTCVVSKEFEDGVELEINGLRGWIFDDQFVALPQEDLLRSGSQPFDAIIVEVDSEERGKLTVSRWPIVQSLIRSIASATPLIGRVTTIKENGADILLAPALKAWMPGEEVSWQRGRIGIRNVIQENQEIAVVLLPQRGNDDSDLRVSKKRVNSGQYIVSGIPGLFFGRQWSNVKAVLDDFLYQKLAVNVDQLASDTTQAQILIGADDAPTFKALVQALDSLASANQCLLSPLGKGRHKPKRVENMPLPRHKKNIPATSAKSTPEVPQPQPDEKPRKRRSRLQSTQDASQPQLDRKSTRLNSSHLGIS